MLARDSDRQNIPKEEVMQVILYSNQNYTYFILDSVKNANKNNIIFTFPIA